VLAVGVVLAAPVVAAVGLLLSVSGAARVGLRCVAAPSGFKFQCTVRLVLGPHSFVHVCECN
jgi:hypothetical protein